MARITALTPVSGRPRRLDIELDAQTFATATAALVKRLGLRVGQQLEPGELTRRLEQAAADEAREIALRCLDRRPYGRRELARRLAQRGIAAAAAEAALSRLAATGLIDDQATARSLVRARIRREPAGRRRLAQELAARGISRDDAEAALQSELPGDEDDACRAAAEVAAGRYHRLPPATRRRRLAAFLHRRGFASDQVRAALDRLWPDGPGTGENEEES